MAFSTHGIRSRMSAHGMAPEGNEIDNQEEAKRIVLGDNLSPRVGLFRGASVRTVGQLDLSNSGIAPLVPENNPGSFFYDLSAIPTFIEPRKLQLAYAQIGGIKPICNGSNSHISKAEFESSKIILKIVQMGKGSNPKVITEFTREVQVMCRMRHPNICGLIGAGTKTESHQNMPFILLERLDGGTLTAKLHNNKKMVGKPFSLPQYLSYAKQFADALAYMHSGWLPGATIIHRDLKPDNIGFSADGTLKLLDFGLCVCVKRRTNTSESYQMTGMTGSLRYMATEVAMCQPYSEAVDIYSFGIIAYEMYVGVAPFGGMNKDAFMQKVVYGGQRPDLVKYDSGSKINADPEVARLLSACWDGNPSARPPAEYLSQKLGELLAASVAGASAGGGGIGSIFGFGRR